MEYPVPRLQIIKEFAKSTRVRNVLFCCTFTSLIRALIFLLRFSPLPTQFASYKQPSIWGKEGILKPFIQSKKLASGQTNYTAVYFYFTHVAGCCSGCCSALLLPFFLLFWLPETSCNCCSLSLFLYQVPPSASFVWQQEKTPCKNKNK